MYGPGGTVTARWRGLRMKTRIGILALWLIPNLAFAWGLETHRWVNVTAIESLPDPLRAHFREHRQKISDAGIEPDTRGRKKHGEREAVRHYIDLDLYGAPPFAELPRNREEAYKKFGKDLVKSRGTLPWTILEKHARLVREMRDGKWKEAVRTAGLAGHYVSDAFMPLHTTDNHDGQKSGNDGIHKAVEHDLVDARIEEYSSVISPQIPPARPEPFTEDVIFKILIESHGDVPVVFRADKAARESGPIGSVDHTAALDREMGRLLTARLAGAVYGLGSFWLSAWDAAGRPAPPRATPRGSD